jgi:signal transduction histidine kinase
MAILGGWITTEISTGTLKSAAVSSSVFMEMFLEPNVQDLAPEGVLPAALGQRLDGILLNTPLGDRLISVKVWRTDGTVVYSTHRDLLGQKFPSPEVMRAAQGEVVAQYNQLNEFDGAFERATGLPLVEVYAPLHLIGTNEVIAVGEYYEHAPWFGEQLQRAQTATWLVVGATTAGMLGILFLIVMRGSSLIASQREELRQRMSEASLMASQNEELRVVADKARLEASEANEQLLARIGSDLHDGPIQLVSLLMLKLSAAQRAKPAARGRTTGHAAEGPGLVQITGDVLTELRNISAGLSLPEIDTISLKEALQLAVFRHEDMTGAKVECEIEDLPENVSLALKTCAYRVVQEALSNAYKHAGDASTVVAASVNAETLLLTVTDFGPGLGTEEKVIGGRQKLGIAGIRNRVGALKGSLVVKSGEGQGTRLSVALPLDC